jgi:hypothetical protein
MRRWPTTKRRVSIIRTRPSSTSPTGPLFAASEGLEPSADQAGQGRAGHTERSASPRLLHIKAPCVLTCHV